MVVVVVLVALCVVGMLVGVHWYLWRRLVRDVSVPGGAWRRTGTVLTFLLPLTTVATMVTSRSDAPFGVQRMLAWPGFLWLALVLYLTLALLVGEAVRFVLRRTRLGAAERRSAGREREGGEGGEGETVAAPGEERDPAAAQRAGGPAAVRTGSGSATLTAAPGTETGTDAGSGPEAQPGTKPGTDPGPGPDHDTDAGSGSQAAAEAPGGPPRRVFLARTLAIGTAAVAAATVGTGAYGVLNGPTLKHVTVPLAKLGRRAHGYRIAVVSDIHLGPILGRAHTQRVVDTINGAQPDLVAVVGDLVDGSVAQLGPAAEPLRDLRARDGSFFVTGNHEYFGDAEEWVDHVRELGVHPLENARKELPGFDLAGVNDISGEDQHQGPDYAKALGDRDTSRASVLLAHQPVMIHEAVDHDVDLQLSGHTHGGQLWPGPYLAALANPTVAGLERYGDTQLYVTRGAGAWGPPVRVGADSDVTIVKLASKQT